MMSKRISETAEKNTLKEVCSLTDHFNDQLIIQKEQIDIVSHDIKSHELYLGSAANDNPNAVDHDKFSDH